MATPKEMLMTYLLEEGCNPLPDGEGIAFKKEGRTYSTFPDPSDPNFFNIYCYFDFEGRVSSRQAGLEAANDVNRSVKVIKVTLPEPNNPSRVGFGVEAPLPQPESFRAIFDRAVHTIGYSAEQFLERLEVAPKPALSVAARRVGAADASTYSFANTSEIERQLRKLEQRISGSDGTS